MPPLPKNVAPAQQPAAQPADNKAAIAKLREKIYHKARAESLSDLQAKHKAEFDASLASKLAAAGYSESASAAPKRAKHSLAELAAQMKAAMVKSA